MGRVRSMGNGGEGREERRHMNAFVEVRRIDQKVTMQRIKAGST